MATYTFEVEVEIDQVNISPAEPDVGIMGETIEDYWLSSVSMQVAHSEPGQKTVWRSVDLLDGLDKEAREQVIRNICSAYDEPIQEAIWEDR